MLLSDMPLLAILSMHRQVIEIHDATCLWVRSMRVVDKGMQVLMGHFIVLESGLRRVEVPRCQVYRQVELQSRWRLRIHF
jgi:hypothetical protein